jgi:hypothetical protein
MSRAPVAARKTPERTGATHSHRGLALLMKASAVSVNLP